MGRSLLDDLFSFNTENGNNQSFFNSDVIRGEIINSNATIAANSSIRIKLGGNVSYTGISSTTKNMLISTGTQYINTGIVPKNHEVVVKFQYTEATNDSCIFGYSSTTFHLTWYSNRWFYACGNSESSFNGTQCTDLQVVDFNNANNKVVMNGVEYASTSGTSSASGNLTIFGRGGSSQQCNAKLYYLKIYDRSTNTLVRDFVPAVSQESGHENENCLYDEVSQTYFYNQGSGAFSIEPYSEYTAHPGDVIGLSTSAFDVSKTTKQWKNNGVNIVGATGNTYTVQNGDEKITCVLTGTGDYCGTVTTTEIQIN